MEIGSPTSYGPEVKTNRQVSADWAKVGVGLEKKTKKNSKTNEKIKILVGKLS